MELQKIKEIVTKWAIHIPEISRVYLYGSRIKGTYKANSDIDIAIEFDQKIISTSEDSSGMAIWFLHSGKWQKELQEKIPVPVQLDWYQPKLTRVVSIGLAEASIVAYEKP